MNVKFTLTKETEIYFGITFFRIKSKKDFADARVEKSPLLIQGTKHIITAINGKIKIGCEEHTIAEWLKNYAKIGKKHCYTDEQINEYHKYILLCAELAKAEGKP
jgi:hypothetical protein